MPKGQRIAPESSLLDSEKGGNRSPYHSELGYVKRIATVICGADVGRQMAAMKMVIDESGSVRVFVVAGYLATVEKWDAFEKQWSSILRDAGLVTSINGEETLLPFHMTDYENRKWPFEQWDNVKRVQVICDLIDAINGAIDCALICRMPLDLFDAAIPPSLRSGKQFLYLACFHSLYLKILEIAKINSLDRVPLFFDRNREVSSAVLAVDEQIRQLVPAIGKYMGALVFDDKCHFLPLQAADILAYETMKDADNIALANNKTRKSFQRLNRKRFEYRAITMRKVLWKW